MGHRSTQRLCPSPGDQPNGSGPPLFPFMRDETFYSVIVKVFRDLDPFFNVPLEYRTQASENPPL